MNLEELKTELRDIAAIVNVFKSEVVQVRVLELLFNKIDFTSNPPKNDESSFQRGPRLNKKSAAKKRSSESNQDAAKIKRSRGGRPGPGAMIKQLKDEGFFKKPQTIPAIIDYCQHKSAYTYKQNEVAITLTRALRSDTLQRKKNDQNQFEYYE